MPTYFEKLDDSEDSNRNEGREWMCVCIIVFLGSSIGFLFVLVREALGLKI